MKRRKKLKPDLRRIRVSQSYTVPDVARLLDRTTPTVRSWIKQGLPVLADTSPRLICGQELKRWLAMLWNAKKRPCAIHEMYCVKCRRPRRPDPASVKTAHLSSKTAKVSAKCGTCATAMQQPRALSKLPEIIAAMTAPTRQQVNLSGYTNPPLDPTFWKGHIEREDERPNTGKNNVH